MRKVTTTIGIIAMLALGFSRLPAQTKSETDRDPDAAPKSDTKEKALILDEFVVTGVFQGTKKEEATVAISTMGSRDVEKLVPPSAAALLSNVPGVFVDSSHGEIRNVVFSRGVSANSLDGATGYFYVAMEEDGLPVTNVTWVNLGPDYFLRADATLDRFEAVRGGAAAVTGPNAPGGIFNFISKQGTDVRSGQLMLRYGLEGDGRNPYYRSDLWLGGPIGKGWTYSVGGFYRRADGSQYPRFPMNDGGQLKANLTKRFDSGFVQFYGKYLHDVNGFANFIPAVDFNDPHPAPGWENYSNPTPPRAAFDYQIGANEFGHFDSGQQLRNTSKVIGMKFEKNLGADWTLSNNIKYSDNASVWNSWIGILPQALTDFYTPIFLGGFGRLGVFTYQDTTTGKSAHIDQTGYFSATILDSTLPLNQLMPAGAFAQIAVDSRPGAKELMDQISVTKKLEHMTFTLGAFLSFSDTRLSTRIPGFGLSTMEPNPQGLDVSVQDSGGQTLQLTNPQGIAGPVGGITENSGQWDQISVFFGHRWEITKDWTIDWGFRSESIDANVRNPTLTGNPPAVTSPTGGPDGNPNTLYDNQYTPPPTSFVTFGRKITNQSYTAALYRKIDKRQSLYLRYSNGAKAPDLAIFFAQNDPAQFQFANTSSQKIQQIELGYKYARPGLSFVVTPYYSLLDNIQTTQVFVNPADGTLYPRITANALESYGVEAESDWVIGNGFAVRAALTWQKGTATKRFNWVQGPSGPSSDTLVDLSGGKADNNPDIMATITPSYAKGRFYGQVQWQYMGKRPANAANAFTLPAFDTTNLMASWWLTSRLSLSVTVNNLFNSTGVMGFTVPATNLIAGLNRQSLTQQQIQAAPNALFTILPIQPRAYFLEATYKF